jgi:hypothetical protein
VSPFRTPGLKRALRSLDYFAIAFGTMVGTVWLLSMGGWLKAGGPYGAIWAFLFGSVASIPIAAVYAHLTQASAVVSVRGGVPRNLSRPAAFWSGNRWLPRLDLDLMCTCLDRRSMHIAKRDFREALRATA